MYTGKTKRAWRIGGRKAEEKMSSNVKRWF
jgi:hypothetical protein